MLRRLLTGSVALALAFQVAATTASAEPPPPPPSPPPPPLGATREEIHAYEAARAAALASTFLERLEAMRAYTAAQLALLRKREAALREDAERLAAQIAVTRAQLADRVERLEEVLRTAYRTSRRSPFEAILSGASLIEAMLHVDALARLGEQERRLVDELRRFEAQLETQQAELRDRRAELAAVEATLLAKEKALETLTKRAARLVEAYDLEAKQRQVARGGRGEAASGGYERGDVAGARTERDVIAELARDRAEADSAVREVLAKLGELSAEVRALVDRDLVGWVWPVEGVVSQGFGPMKLSLEPPRTVDGVRHEHFHEA